MTRTVVSTSVILAAVAAAWLSLKIGEQTNQEAAGRVIQTLDNKVEIYRKENSDNFAAVISHVDAGQDKTVALAEQIKGIANTLVGMGQQSTQLLEGQNEVLAQHGRSLEEVKSGANQAKAKAAEAVTVARRDQVQTRRVIREINKPKKSWWSGLFSSPTPHK